MFNLQSFFLCVGLSSSLLAQDAPLPVAIPLQKTLSHLDTDGEYISLNNTKGDYSEIATLLDKILLEQMRRENPAFSKFSFQKLLNNLGLDKPIAIGNSSKSLQSSFINKTFIDTDGSTSGVLSLLSNQPIEWQSSRFAPSDTDLILETAIDLRKLPDFLNQQASIFPEEISQQYLSFLDTAPFPNEASTTADLLKQANLRLSLALKLDPSRKWEPEENITLPAFDGCIRLDGAAKLLWPRFEQELKKQLPIESKGNIHTIMSPSPVPAPWGDIKPVVVVDLDEDQIWIYSDQAYFQKVTNNEKPLISNKTYIETCKSLPKEGTTHAYVSPAVPKLLGSLAKVFANEEPDAKPVINMLTKSTLFNQAYAFSLKHDQAGIYIVSNSPFAQKGENMMSTLSLTAGLAAMSYGPIMKQLELAETNQEILNYRNLYTACLDYAKKNDGLFPPSIEELHKENLIDEQSLLIEVNYVTGLTTASRTNKVILYSDLREDRKRIVTKIDSSVQLMTEAEFQKAIKK